MSETETETNLTPKQRLALASLAVGSSPAEAARAAGVGRSTVYRWLADPAFTTELRKADGDTLRRLGRLVMALSEKAAKALEAALDPTERMTTRLRAAAVILERGPALAELTSILERLDELEVKLGR